MRDDLNATRGRGAWRCSIRSGSSSTTIPDGESEDTLAPNHPQQPELGRRAMPFVARAVDRARRLRRDAAEGLLPADAGRRSAAALRYIVRCTGFEKDDDGNVTAVHCTYDPATRSGTPGADARKVKGNIHWLSVGARRAGGSAALRSAVRVPFPGARIRAARAATPAARSRRRRMRVVAGRRGRRCRRGPRAQFPRRSQPGVEARHHGVRRACARATPPPRSASSSSGTATSSPISSTTRPARPVFNRTVTLRDSWAKQLALTAVAASEARNRCSATPCDARRPALILRRPRSLRGDSMKRIILFLATNLAVVLVLSVVLKLFGLDRAMARRGHPVRAAARRFRSSSASPARSSRC